MTAAMCAWRLYEAVAFTPVVFSAVLLVLAGAAVAGGALQTIGETLGHSVQADRATAPITMPPSRERPASLAPIPEPRSMPVPERSNRLFDADHLLAAARHWNRCLHWPGTG